MRPVNFLLCCFFGFFLLAAAYALIIDKVVIPDRTVPFLYEQFLLESSAAIKGKVVIDSGSNSNHGIDTFLLSEYFKAPVIIIADNGTYPLRNKIFRMKKYVSRGDVLILPLEWQYYLRSDALAEHFLTLIADENLSLEYYFNELPAIEKLRFIFTKYPLTIALESLDRRDVATVSRTERYRLVAFEEVLKAADNESFGGSIEDGPKEMPPGTASLTCDQYLSLLGKPNISNIFVSDLALLQGLANSGVNIVFTWPSMVDSQASPCFTKPGALQNAKRFSREIVELVESRGFKFIGKVEDGRFTSECFLDTYYHLRHSCSKERTTRLIEALKREKVQPINSPYTPNDLLNSARANVSKAKAILPN